MSEFRGRVGRSSEVYHKGAAITQLQKTGISVRNILYDIGHIIFL